jgi:hypothetical protein
VEGFSGERLLGELDRMRKKDIGGGLFTDYVERYQWFLLVALMLFIAGLGLSNRRGAWMYVKRQNAKGKGQNEEAE